MKRLIALTLVTLSAIAADSTIDTIYKCYVQGYDPPVCQVVRPSVAESVQFWADLLGDPEAPPRWVTNPADGPMTEGCSNSHGQSGCCRVIGEFNGIVYVECGPR